MRSYRLNRCTHTYKHLTHTNTSFLISQKIAIKTQSQIKHKKKLKNFYERANGNSNYLKVAAKVDIRDKDVCVS